jgi:hypothetical protein
MENTGPTIGASKRHSIETAVLVDCRDGGYRCCIAARNNLGGARRQYAYASVFSLAKPPYHVDPALFK